MEQRPSRASDKPAKGHQARYVWRAGTELLWARLLPFEFEGEQAK